MAPLVGSPRPIRLRARPPPCAAISSREARPGGDRPRRRLLAQKARDSPPIATTTIATISPVEPPPELVSDDACAFGPRLLLQLLLQQLGLDHAVAVGVLLDVGGHRSKRGVQLRDRVMARQTTAALSLAILPSYFAGLSRGRHRRQGCYRQEGCE